MSNMTQIPDYEEVVRLEKLITEIRGDTPAGLRFSGMSQSILDPPVLIFNRFKLELLFHKTRCVLHRRYMSQEDVGTPREKSREICVKAAMSILQQHEAIFMSAQDGGQLSSSRFYIAGLNSADFILGAMILTKECSTRASGMNGDPGVFVTVPGKRGTCSCNSGGGVDQGIGGDRGVQLDIGASINDGGLAVANCGRRW